MSSNALQLGRNLGQYASSLALVMVSCNLFSLPTVRYFLNAVFHGKKLTVLKLHAQIKGTDRQINVRLPYVLKATKAPSDTHEECSTRCKIRG